MIKTENFEKNKIKFENFEKKGKILKT